MVVLGLNAFTIKDVLDPSTAALSTFPKLTCYTLYPAANGPTVIAVPAFSEIVKSLLRLPPGRLKEIHLHFNIYSYHLEWLTKFQGLRQLTLGRPSRFILLNIPGWISEMKETLQTFSILVPFQLLEW